MKNKSPNFRTIIWIVIVILTVSLWLSLILFSNQPYNKRDGSRANHISMLRTALDLYYRDVGKYPETLNFGGELKHDETIYLGVVPENPKPNDGNCPIDFEYKYEQTRSGQSYKLEYCIGNDRGKFSKGIHTATPNGIADP